MSLILEALKKSEAKRRLGEAPDIGTPFTTPRRRGSALPLLVLAALAAGAFGWWYLYKPAALNNPAGTAVQNSPVRALPAAAPPVARPQQAASTTAQSPAVAAPPPRPHGEPSAPPAPAETSKFVALGNASLMRRGAPPAGKLPPNMHRVDTAANAVKTPAAPAVAVQTPVAQPPAAAGTANPQAPAAEPAAPNKAPKTADMRGVAAVAAAPATKPEPVAAAAAPQAPAKSDLPFYYELPFNVRKSLPSLSLSMHVYAGDPKQRFVILNDSRLTEGDKTNDEVLLREVRKDGAVLEFQGQRFFYPRDNM